LPTGEEVDVQVGDRFAGMGPVVDHQPKALGEAQLAGHLARHEQQVAQERFVALLREAHAGDGLPGDDKEVNGSLGLDIVDHEAAVILVFDACGDFAIGNFLEEGLGGHGGEADRRARSDKEQSEVCIWIRPTDGKGAEVFDRIGLLGLVGEAAAGAGPGWRSGVDIGDHDRGAALGSLAAEGGEKFGAQEEGAGSFPIAEGEAGVLIHRTGVGAEAPKKFEKGIDRGGGHALLDAYGVHRIEHLGGEVEVAAGE